LSQIAAYACTDLAAALPMGELFEESKYLNKTPFSRTFAKQFAGQA